ncbi:MAG: thioredoxin family protein [Peptococcaceae bacterium]|nr:thioredoxin family protein [Peptococcaceae bacterium]
MEIKVLGPGCRKCETLAKEVYKALERLKIPADVKKITDVNEIAGHNILMTPGLIINGKIKSAGKVPKPQQIEKWIQEEVPLSIRF